MHGMGNAPRPLTYLDNDDADGTLGVATITDVWDAVDRLWLVARDLDRAAAVSSEAGSRDLDEVTKHAIAAAEVANALVVDLEDVQRRWSTSGRLAGP